MQNIWLIADTHFEHKNIIKYENRPFKTVYDMKTTIINNWNSKVKKFDKVFFLGDFALANKELTKDIIQQLKGHKIMVKGNHDTRSNDYWLEAGFKEVSKYPIVLVDKNVILSHQPIDIDTNIGELFNIHGHVHSVIGEYETKYPNRYKCVSVENTNYTPVPLSEIINKN